MARSFLPARFVVLAGLLGLATITLAACNTMEGVGQDMQAAGENLEDEAEDANN